ncbi:uncharacterized protein LOC129594997 isoform X2 [Paramacrobiotus metropolitanus]|uniref:uncharacterized protein LOC129594997 isoform X2 n=1 Tax=Paramacrobiotus metropolitanus TaxID=2943436 RepID=UPI002445E5BE|nr:uncharacterized protein LOC129594997 isoform X2 [Paramacrobiotus metropolitanus]
MYLFKEYKQRSSVFAWNSVDVLTDSGILQHGTRSQLVEFGKIYECSDDSSVLDYGRRPFEYTDTSAPANFAVQVLLRTDQAGPWMWYPATLIAKTIDFFYGGPFGFVEVQLGKDYTIQELLPLEQIRYPPLSRRVVQKDTFVTRSCPLPRSWSALNSRASNWFVERIQSRHKILPLMTHSEVVVYLQCGNHDPLRREQLVDVYDFIAKRPGVYIDKSDAERCLFSSSRRAVRKRERDQVAFNYLPVELLCDVFLYVDTVTRQCCRRTYSLWNQVVQTSKNMVVSFQQHNFLRVEKEWLPLYAVTNCLLKCITPMTKCIAIKKMTEGDYELLNIMGTIKQPYVKQLVFCQSEFGMGQMGTPQLKYLADQLAGLREYCKAVVLKDCMFLSNDCTPVINHVIIDPASKNLEETLWNIYENHQPFDGEVDSLGVCKWFP